MKCFYEGMRKRYLFSTEEVYKRDTFPVRVVYKRVRGFYLEVKPSLCGVPTVITPKVTEHPHPRLKAKLTLTFHTSTNGHIASNGFDRKEKITSLDSTRLYSRYLDFPLEFTTDFRPTFLLSFSFLRDYNNTCVVKILDQMSIKHRVLIG